MKEEWRIFETKNPKLKDKFLCGFIDKKKTEARKCVRCKSVFSCKKSNTSALERHISSCTSTESEDVNQISIRKFLNSNTEKFTFHTQFVYLDNVAGMSSRLSWAAQEGSSLSVFMCFMLSRSTS